MTSDDRCLPAPLAAARRRFENWRLTRSRPRRIPPALWKAAARCAARYGIHPTARALHLEFNSLKRRVVASTTSQPVEGPPPAFVELALPAGNGPAGCILEVVRPEGAKLRVELQGSGIPDLADLLRRFAAEEA